MDTERILALIETHASELVAIVLLVAAFRIARELVPIRLSLGHLGRLVRPLLVVGIVVAAIWALPPLGAKLPAPSLRWLLLGWMFMGLPVYGLWRWHRGIEAREAHARRIDAARGNERRRGAPPLPGGQAPGALHGPAAPPAPGHRP